MNLLTITMHSHKNSLVARSVNNILDFRIKRIIQCFILRLHEWIHLDVVGRLTQSKDGFYQTPTFIWTPHFENFDFNTFHLDNSSHPSSCTNHLNLHILTGTPLEVAESIFDFAAKSMRINPRLILNVFALVKQRPNFNVIEYAFQQITKV
jgi:hypothetical protein